MNLKAKTIRAYGEKHSLEETTVLIKRLFGIDTPKDDRGHWYKEAGAPCPHERPSKKQQSGANSGAKKTPGWEERHAERYYESVRKRSPYVDAKRIAKHCKELSVDQIELIRKHMFVDEHDLDKGHVRFDTDPDQAQAWQRLTEGKGTKIDILMLKHELEELTLMKKYGYNYKEAHEKANEKYNWWEAFQKSRGEEE